MAGIKGSSTTSSQILLLTICPKQNYKKYFIFNINIIICQFIVLHLRFGNILFLNYRNRNNTNTIMPRSRNFFFVYNSKCVHYKNIFTNVFCVFLFFFYFFPHFQLFRNANIERTIIFVCFSSYLYKTLLLHIQFCVLNL